MIDLSELTHSFIVEQYFKTEPFACDPSSLPKYPPSKEIDAKVRDDAKRQQQQQQQRPNQEKQDSQTRRSHERKLIPPVKANPSLTTAMEVTERLDLLWFGVVVASDPSES